MSSMSAWYDQHLSHCTLLYLTSAFTRSNFNLCKSSPVRLFKHFIEPGAQYVVSVLTTAVYIFSYKQHKPYNPNFMKYTQARIHITIREVNTFTQKTTPNTTLTARTKKKKEMLNCN